MEVRFEVTEARWVNTWHATMNVDIYFGDHRVSINHVEVGQHKSKSNGGYGVFVPRHRGGPFDKPQPAVVLSEDLYTGLRRAAIAAFKAGAS